jgi:hypothetical protein
MVEGGGEEKHILIDERLDVGGVDRGGTTRELLPLREVMQVSSRSR